MKRSFDLIASMALILVLLPVLVGLSIAVFLLLGWPVLFVQERPGKGGVIFKMHKFRSMSNARNQSGDFLSDDLRLGRFGLFLRKSSLDELPELFDVLSGRMSLVGPRPLLPEYLGLYNTDQARRHDVRPGITGWAQVKGRNSLSWQEKFEYDLWYVDNRTFLLDLKIIFLTVLQVFKTAETSEDGSITMTRFTGNDQS